MLGIYLLAYIAIGATGGFIVAVVCDGRRIKRRELAYAMAQGALWWPLAFIILPLAVIGALAEELGDSRPWARFKSWLDKPVCPRPDKPREGK